MIHIHRKFDERVVASASGVLDKTRKIGHEIQIHRRSVRGTWVCLSSAAYCNAGSLTTIGFFELDVVVAGRLPLLVLASGESDVFHDMLPGFFSVSLRRRFLLALSTRWIIYCNKKKATVGHDERSFVSISMNWMT